MTPHLLAGLKVPRLRGPPDIKTWAPALLAAVFIIAAGTLITTLLPQDTSRWMRLSAWIAPASLAFTAWWWKVQRD